MPDKTEEQFYKEHFFQALEKRFDKIDYELKDIKENHLEHIYNRLGRIEKKLAYYMGGIAVLVIVLEIVLRYIIR